MLQNAKPLRSRAKIICNRLLDYEKFVPIRPPVDIVSRDNGANMKPDNVEILDMYRGVDTSEIKWPPGGCCQPDPRLMTALRFYARKEIKEQWRAAGIKVQYCLPREINQAAEQWLTEHWRDVLPQAEALRARVNVTTNAQKRKQPKSMGSAVQNSRSKVEDQSC